MTRDAMIETLNRLRGDREADAINASRRSVEEVAQQDVDALDMALSALRSRPAPPDDLAKLPARWRDEADGVAAMGYSQQAERMTDCADELERALAAPAPVAAPAHVSVSQGAALAAALDALESDATTDQRREAWDRLRDEFYPVAAPAGVCAALTCRGRVVDGRCVRCGLPPEPVAAPAPETPAPNYTPPPTSNTADASDGSIRDRAAWTAMCERQKAETPAPNTMPEKCSACGASVELCLEYALTALGSTTKCCEQCDHGRRQEAQS